MAVGGALHRSGQLLLFHQFYSCLNYMPATEEWLLRCYANAHRGGTKGVTEIRVTQKLAAILIADVVGYSRLMQNDDRATVAKLDECRLIFRDRAAANQGRIESMAGDSVLAVFETAIGAAQAAVDIQKDLARWNAALPDERQMRFRIGVHMGDVIEKPDGTVYGDGVNIAARLETLADAGGITVSSMVYESVSQRLEREFDYLGEHVVKNIAESVRAYRVLIDGGEGQATPAVRHSEQGRPVEIVYQGPLLQRVIEQAEAVAGSDATVLIEGESGVGKEIVARFIHEKSRRNNGPFIKVDCAAVPPDLFEQEFFGQSAGASPGALRDQIGRLEMAGRGTLFLDHVADLPAEFQAKLLRPLQDSTFERLGDNRTRQADVRFIAATTRSLADCVATGDVRRDLYFRLSVFPISVPPLRARTEDIAGLVEHFLEQQASTSGSLKQKLSEEQLDHLRKYDWPGNVRELRNLIERALILSADGPLQLSDALPRSNLSYPARAPMAEAQTPARGFFSVAEFKELERNNFVAALESAGWRISGSGGAAEMLGLTAAKLRSRMKALNIGRPVPDSLFMRLGGSRGIATFARELFGRAIAHPELGRFWQDRSTYGVLREERLLAAYLSSVAGGPARYVGRDMKSAHDHLGIRASDWEIFRNLLRSTLEALSVPEAESREVIEFAESLREDVVRD